MTIEAYLEAIKERLVTDPMVTRFHMIRERSTLIDGHLRARLTLVDGRPGVFCPHVTSGESADHAEK
jgi:hypothetical protein